MTKSRYAIICFEHDRRIVREIVPPCMDLDVDIRVPWSWVDEATIGEVRSGEGATSAGDTVQKIDALARLYQPSCPACRELLHHTTWTIETLREDQP